MGGLQAGVSLTRVRVSVNVGSTDAHVVYVLPVAAVKHIHLVVGAELDSIGFNRFVYEMLATVDQALLGVGKAAVDHVGVADETTYVLFKKGAIEQLHTAETRSFVMAKELSDVVDATDDFMGTANLDDEQVMVFSKALPVEQLGALDNTKLGTGKRVTDAAHPVDVRTVDVVKGRTENLGTTEIRTTSFEKTLTDSVDAGDEFNAVASTDDGEVIVFGKTLADTWTYDDSINVQAEKYFEDTVNHPTDQLDYIEVGKGIDDPIQTSEDTLMFVTSKALADVLAPVEQVGLGIGYTIQDWANQGEGPNLYDTYAVGYFLETYALEGFPRLDIVKGLTDTVHATDDFFGVANADDDEVMQFGKTLNEVFHYGDQANLGYNKPLADLVSRSDVQVVFVGKGLTDTAATSESISKAGSKTLTDGFNTADSVLRVAGKAISDSANTAEYNSFVLQKNIADTVQTTDDFLGNANADDDETMLFNKTVNDSFTKSDLVSIGAGKDLADSASTSESGSIVWTDYWPIGYTDTTSGVYVGTQRTF